MNIDELVEGLEKLILDANDLTLKIHPILKDVKLPIVIFAILNLKEGITRVDPKAWDTVQDFYDKTKSMQPNEREGH